MWRFLIALVLLGIVNTGFAGAETSSPAMGSSERKAILDVARQPAQARLHQDVQFQVRQFNVVAGWAFVHAVMQRPDGRPIDYSRTPDAEAARHGGKSNRFAALLRQQGEGWKVVAYAVGPTDVAWERWSKEYSAPSELFGMPTASPRPDDHGVDGIRQWWEQNGLCRGLPGDDPRSQAACAQREKLQVELQRIGWCFGKPGEIGAQMQWHRCGPDSSRN